MSKPPKPWIYKCPKCDTFCIKNVKKFPDGKVLHMACGAKVVDVTEEFDKANSAPSDFYD